MTVRTEVDVAAETVAVLMLRGIIPREETIVRRTLEAVGIDLARLQTGLARVQARGHLKPADEPVYGPRLDAEPDEEAQAAPKRQAWNKTPEADTRVCKGPCGEEKPIGCFQKRTDANSRRTWCDDCRLEDQRRRYLSAGKIDALNKLRVEFRIVEGDDVEGLVCVDCDQPIQEGDLVHAEADVRHANCPSLVQA